MRNKGFTLIELMIVVAILAILAALAIPALKSSSPPTPTLVSSNEATGQQTWRVPSDCVPRFQAEHPDYMVTSVVVAEQTKYSISEYIYVITKVGKAER